MAIVETLLTAEEYGLLPDNGQPTELVRGRIVPLNMPYPRHGYYCSRVVHLLASFLDDHALGRVMSNDSGVVTERGPDTVRGADVSYYSYDRLPRGDIPNRYLTVAPELVIEVRSQGDRWSEVLVKVSEYLNAGVTVVCVLDPQTRTLHVYRAEQSPEILREEDEFALPDILPGLSVPVRRFFE